MSSGYEATHKVEKGYGLKGQSKKDLYEIKYIRSVRCKPNATNMAGYHRSTISMSDINTEESSRIVKRSIQKKLIC